jgi:hypothetical protein
VLLKPRAPGGNVIELLPDVCVCNKYECLFFKYIDYMNHEHYKKKRDDKICEYTPCEELMDPNTYEFVDSKQVIFIL